jgi:hypothetical protein
MFRKDATFFSNTFDLRLVETKDTEDLLYRSGGLLF